MWRKRGARANALAALAVLASAVGSARDARACSQPLPGWYGGLVTSEVPTDGVVIVSFTCWYQCTALDPPSVVVRDAVTDSEVPGAMSPLSDVPEESHVYGWRPTEPLAVGRYEVDLANVPMQQTSVFEAVPPVAVDFDELEFTRTLEPFERDEGEQTCCPTGPINSCGQHACYTEEFQRFLSVGVEWTSAAAPSGFGQYLARATWNDRDPEDWAARRSSFATFDVAADEYCYVLEFKSLADGTVTKLPEQCMPHPSDVALGLYEKDSDDIRSYLGTCDAPPEGLEDTWCEARAERCATLMLTQCENLETLCPDLPEDGGVSDGGRPDAGGGGAGPDEPDAGDVDAGDADAGQPQEPDSGSRTIRTNAGCGCVATGAHGSSPLWPAALAILIALYRRRGRSV